MGEVKLTVTIPNGENPGAGNSPDTSRMEASGLLLDALKPHAKFKFTGPHEAELTLPDDAEASRVFAQKFALATKGFLYDWDNNPHNDKAQVVTESSVAAITGRKITDLVAAIRTSKKPPTDWYDFFRDRGGLTLEQFQLIKSSGVYDEMLAHSPTFSQAADQLLRAYEKRLKSPVAIRYWDLDGNLETLHDLYWMPETTFDVSAATLANIQPVQTASAPATAQAAVGKNSLPEFTEDMKSRPESYLFYPLLLEKGRRTIALDTGKTNPVEPAIFKIPNTHGVPSQEQINDEIQGLLKKGSIRGVADHNATAKDTYYLDPSYFRKTQIGGQDVVFLVLPKLEKWCDPASYVARTAAGVVGYVEFKFAIPADRLPHLRDALVVLPQQICSFTRTGVPGAQNHTLRIKAPVESIRQLLEAAERVLEASKSGEPLADSSNQKMKLLEGIVGEVNDATLKKLIEELKTLEKDTKEIYDYTNDPESNLWLYLIGAFVLVNLLSEHARKFEMRVLGKLRSAIFVRPSTVKSATAQYQPLWRRLPKWWSLKKDQAIRGVKRVIKADASNFVPFKGQETLRRTVIERAKMPRGTVKSIGLVAEKGSGKSHFVEDLIHGAATGNIPELAHLEFWYVTANGIQRVGSGIADIPAAVDDLVKSAENPNVVIVIDEVQSTVDVGTHSESSISPFTEALLPKLEGKQIFAIVMTTPEGRQYLRKKNAPLDDRFDWHKMPRLSSADLYEAMRVHADRVQKNRGITITDNAVKKAIELAYLISDKNENRGVADFFDSLVEFVKITTPDKTEIDAQDVDRFVAKEIREEKQFLVDGLIVDIKNIVKEHILKKLGLDLGELNLAEDVYRSLDVAPGKSHADAMARLRRVLMVLQNQARILDDPFITSDTRVAALEIISQTLTIRDGTKENATTPEELAAEAQRAMMQQLRTKSAEGAAEAPDAPSPKPSPPTKGEGKSRRGQPRRGGSTPVGHPVAGPSVRPTPARSPKGSPSPQPSPLKGEGKKTSTPETPMPTDYAGLIKALGMEDMVKRVKPGTLGELLTLNVMGHAASDGRYEDLGTELWVLREWLEETRDPNADQRVREFVEGYCKSEMSLDVRGFVEDMLVRDRVEDARRGELRSMIEKAEERVERERDKDRRESKKK